MKSSRRVAAATLDVLDVFVRDVSNDKHGFTVARRTHRPVGAIYPILMRLEEMGWLASRWDGDAPEGRPRRRLYYLTEPGLAGATGYARPALRAGAGRVPRLAVLVPGLVALLVMVCGITGSSYWKDETATVSATARSLPGLVRMLGRTDAVHGLYYLLMWVVARVAGASELAFRLPSAVGMVLAAAGISVIGWPPSGHPGALPSWRFSSGSRSQVSSRHASQPPMSTTSAPPLPSCGDRPASDKE